jgi:3-phenylpropionate/trans-cinnamate dioxygenase ferredoxin reductase component
MSTQPRTFVIVGASLTGAKAAETLREEGFDGRVILIGAEPERPYERPPLTKDYLRSESPREKAYVHPEAFYREHDIELITGTAVTALQAGRSGITLEDGREFSYDRLLLATGAEPRRLSIPGADLDGIHYLRTLEAKGKVTVIGAGWIGAEFAASARQLGAEVTVLEPASVPLERVLGAEVGGVYRDIHRDHGVELLLGTGVEAFDGDGSVQRVKTSDGRTIACDFAVVGVGIVPRVALAEAAGLETDNGILVDQSLATSHPDSTRPVTSPTPGIPSTTGGFGSSTGPTRSTRGPPPRGPCSGSMSSTTASRTSSRTSTTSGWSTRGSRPSGTRSYFAASRPIASSSRSGCGNNGS